MKKNRDYTLPKVVSSKNKDKKSKEPRAHSNLLRGYDNSHGSNRTGTINDKTREDN
ncbi:MAG: hypothetical protein IJ272_10325 [Clostridia bacterium]|nr:hypothetical protein [Clostridia bacterium]